MTEFTPWSALFGGALIGLSAVLMMAVLGRIAGISGIVSRLLPPIVEIENYGWRVAFVVGLVLAPVILTMAGEPTALRVAAAHSVSNNSALLVLAGLLVGFGSVYGSGCTSGHGVCGLSRLSVRSLVATVTFMATGAITVFVMRHIVGG